MAVVQTQADNTRRLSYCDSCQRAVKVGMKIGFGEEENRVPE
jgi:hypothetical protein